MSEPLTPFERDCRDKAGPMREYRNERARRSTCRCGVVKKWHSIEVESGRCKRFRSMTLKEWAEWVGVEVKG